MTSLLTHIENLCRISAISGDESRVASYIKKHAEGHADVKQDALGNLICKKKGAKTPSHTLMVCAHMDEVGFLVTGITPDGMLRIAPVGGIDARVVIGKPVLVGERELRGVIGTKAIHLQSAAEREEMPDIDSLFVDIGAENKEEAEALAAPGDSIVWESETIRFGEGFLKARALDDRAGCAIMLALMEKELPWDVSFVFTVQEEVGTRGAASATFGVHPDVALILETTTAADIGEVEKAKQVCRLGEGPVLSVMDKGAIYDKKLLHFALTTAGEQGIPVQIKEGVYGGNDAQAVHVSREGVRTLAISMPCRYLHSPSCVLKITDIENTMRLACALLGASWEGETP